MSGVKVLPLAEVAEIAAGITLGRTARDSELVEVPYLRVANVQDGHLLLDDVKTIAATRAEIDKLALRDGDLLLTEGGDLDKLGRGACWRNQLPLCLHQNHIFRVRLPKDRFDPDYVSFQIASPYGKAYFLAHAKKTTGIASINQRVLGAFPLITPSLAQQQEIAARLKAQMAEVEAARRAAKSQCVDVENLDRCLLQATFEELLAKHHRRTRLKDVCTISAGGTPSRGNQSFFKGDIPWVKTLDLNFSVVTETEESISKEGFRAIRGEILPAGTVMVAMYGGAGTIGKSGILGIEACTNQAICALQPNRELLLPEFLHEWIRHIRPEWMRFSGGNRKDPNISKSVVEEMTVPIPSRELQRRLLIQLKLQLAEARTIRDGATAQFAEIEELPQKLLAEAFGSAA